MADWYGNRSRETFTFRRVSWADFATRDSEVSTYTQFTGGSIEYGAYTALKSTGTFDYVGETPDTVDLLRVYYSFTDDAGERSEPEALGTFILGYDSIANRPGGESLLASGSVTGHSVLKVLSDHLLGLPVTVAAGTNPVELAAQIVADHGLRANYPRNTDYSLSAAHTFEADDSWLAVVNWLLSNCSTQFQAATVDGYGIVQIREYEDPMGRTPKVTFASGERSIMLPEVDEDAEWMTAANVVRLYFESDTCAMWASASALNGSRAALSNRGGREITAYEQIDEIDNLDALKALAVSRLKDKSGQVEHVDFGHGFIPLAPGDPVAIEYADRTWLGSVQNMQLSLIPSVPVKTQLRKYVPASLSVEVDGGVLWEVE